MTRLDISVVVHDWEPEIFLESLTALSKSLDFAKAQGNLASARLWLGYNGFAPLNSDLSDALEANFTWDFTIFPNEKNLGYGGSHNQLMERILANDELCDGQEQVILVMNPDVAPGISAIANGLRRQQNSSRTGFISPRILGWSGQHESVGHKRYPSLAVLAARFLKVLFAVPFFARLNDHYEYRDAPMQQGYSGIELCSGCFLFAKRELWVHVGGFDDAYFMYFEDFDLSLRAAQLGWDHTYDPSVSIRHAGGDAGRKNTIHRKMFVQSAWKFFTRHGWRVWRIGG